MKINKPFYIAIENNIAIESPENVIYGKTPGEVKEELIAWGYDKTKDFEVIKVIIKELEE